VNNRETFGRVRSTIRNRIMTDNRTAVEWSTKGTSGDGGEIDYEGVSILKLEGQKIKRFYAYFDPAQLGQQIAAC
jgi:ketosteroid isomerase-like protein